MLPDDQKPITLKEACSRVFAGSITPATLRAEAGRGNLKIFRIGKRDFTTVEDINRMVELCREKDHRRGYTWTPSAESGSSETDRISAAQDAVSNMLNGRKKSSPNTSAENTSPH